MALPLHRRYEIVFLSHHPLGPKLGQKAVAKEVKCDKKAVKYWLDRWNESKDLSDSIRSGRPRATAPKVDQEIVSRASQQTFVTSRAIQNQLKRQHVEISDRTVRRRLSEAGAKFGLPMSKPLLTDQHQENRLTWAHAHVSMGPCQAIFLMLVGEQRLGHRQTEFRARFT